MYKNTDKTKYRIPLSKGQMSDLSKEYGVTERYIYDIMSFKCNAAVCRAMRRSAIKDYGAKLVQITHVADINLSEL